MSTLTYEQAEIIVEAERYRQFIKQKQQIKNDGGFTPLWIPDQLFDFQKSLVIWAVQKGRAGLFADCGMGKGFMQLVWAENVVRKTNKPVLILAPLAVAAQFILEAEKFGISAVRSSGGSHARAEVVITNYEKLHHFNTSDFAGVDCDESSILKNFDGARKQQITEFMRSVQYRLLGTATAAPNDFHEVGTSSEALGYLGARDMLTRFFKEEVKKDYLGWGRTKYRFRGHAEHPFWQWVCSWARACRKPSDLGFSDDKFILPPLTETETVVEDSTPREGMLFSTPARDLREQREERRVTIQERCEIAAKIAIKHKSSSVLWCHLNDEGDLLEKLIPDCAQVSGSMSDEEKEEKLVAFQSGQIKRLITKPKIASFGLNWQHCHNVITFPSHSFEQYYQAVRRCWRFGQTKPVKVNIITTAGERGVIANLKRKQEQADRMFNELVAHMNNAMAIDRGFKFTTKEEVPSWL